MTPHVVAGNQRLEKDIASIFIVEDGVCDSQASEDVGCDHQCDVMLF